MANRAYKPQADSVPARVIAYFMANPDEELVNTDLAIKFNKHYSAFHSLLASAVEEAYLSRGVNDDDDVIYGLGDVLAPGIVAQAGPAATDVEDRFKKPSEPKARHVRRDPFVCDPLAIEIKTGVAMPVGRTARGTDWSKLLERMQKGQYAELPVAAFSSLSGYCTKAKKAGQGEFLTRKLSGEVLGLWRVA